MVARVTLPDSRAACGRYSTDFGRVLVGLGLAVGISALSFATAPEIDFERDVAPIFSQHCAKCHHGAKACGELDLTRAEGLLAGDSPIVVAGKPEESLLLEMVSGQAPEMPRDGPALTAEQIDLIHGWIEQGAAWPAGVSLEVARGAATDWWSLRPLRQPDLPPLDAADAAWGHTPIDAFVMAKLREMKMSPAPEADRRTLIRRLSFDLTGLPPEPEAVEAFVHDAHPRAYQRLVDRLLASPAYGERWARHWLDVVHYGDTHGFDKDKVRWQAWPYRDYVIRALNEDKPYDRFVREQLAGDRLYPGTSDGVVALGFIAAGPFDWVGQVEVADGTVEKKRVRNLDRDDMVRTTMETFCSTTVGCARCHDHKFDPISSEEYYRLQAVFAAVDRADRPYDAKPDVARQRFVLEDEILRLAAQVGTLDVVDRGAAGGADDNNRATRERLKQTLKEARARLAALPPPEMVYAAASSFSGQGQFQPTHGRARPVFLLQRGSVTSPGKQVAPGALGCLPDLRGYFDDAPDLSAGQGRAALAEWILDHRNPLTWRSIVNRIWQYHFGQGLVETPNDFGRMGAQPSHPELLDWLAAGFRDRSRSLKQLHRLLVMSATYRQSSAGNANFSRIDGDNRYLWRMNRRRLEAEAVHDAVLAISGQLDRTMGGPGYKDFAFEDDHSPRYKYEQHDPDDPASHRRSIYRLVVRSVPDPFLTALDCADPSMGVGKRNETLTPLQALTLLNNPYMVCMAEHFAGRVRQLASAPAEQVAACYRLAFGREPRPSETGLLTGMIHRQGLPYACRLLFNTNEFLYVD